MAKKWAVELPKPQMGTLKAWASCVMTFLDIRVQTRLLYEVKRETLAGHTDT